MGRPSGEVDRGGARELSVGRGWGEEEKKKKKKWDDVLNKQKRKSWEKVQMGRSEIENVWFGFMGELGVEKLKRGWLSFFVVLKKKGEKRAKEV